MNLVYTMCMSSDHKGQKRVLNSWELGFGWLLTTIGMLETKAVSSARAVNVLNHEVISSPGSGALYPCFLLLNERKNFCQTNLWYKIESSEIQIPYLLLYLESHQTDSQALLLMFFYWFCGRDHLTGGGGAEWAVCCFNRSLNCIIPECPLVNFA